MKYRELILSWSMRFTLALFSEQCSVLCQNCCHGYQLINHLQVVLDVVSLSFLPQHNHWQSLCLFLNPHKWKCWLAWFKITVKPALCGSVSPEFVSPWFSPQLSGHLYEAVAITFEWAWTASLYYLPPVLSSHLKRNYLNKSKNYPSRKIWSIYSFRNQCQ